MKRRIILLGLFFCAQYMLHAQTQPIQITGTVTDGINGEPLVNATISFKGSNVKVLTNDKGRFTAKITGVTTIIAQVSCVNYESLEIPIQAVNDEVAIPLQRSGMLSDVQVTAPDRRLTSLLRAPVSVERISLSDIRNSPASNSYGILAAQTGVDVTISSLNFTTVSTRGFNGSGSSRVNQLVDGMDNQAPGLNFFLGNFVGLTELDVESMELLPGASSALYGPGGINGTILINSKSPFKHQGLSILVKQGVMHVDKSQRDKASPYYDYSLRWAKVFNDKFAIKLGAQYISAKDWLANDTSNYQRMGNTGKVIPGSRASDPNYDGVNVYGDETKFDIRPALQGVASQDPMLPFILAPFLSNPQNISRTGYAEKDIINPVTKNVKLAGALHYKLSSRLEAILMGYWATGNTVYTGNNRYALKGIKIGQYKLELKSDDWFIRSYTTQEDAGQAYSATVTTQYFNEGWKPSSNWYPQYIGGIVNGSVAVFMDAINKGKTPQEAQAAVAAAVPQLHLASRGMADQGRPVAGSDQFNQLFDKIRKTPIVEGGGLFLEKSQLWMTEGQYDLSKKVKFVDLVVGGNWKKYVLDSDGTLFIDSLKAITFNEIGAYAQIGKSLFQSVLRLSFSGRYDKNEDFKGRFTPRATALVSIAKDHNLRFSYQTAYRFPTTQQKYIRLDVGEYTLLGGLPWVMDYMQAGKNPVFEMTDQGLQPYTYKEFKPESMSSFEVGYKALIHRKILVDGYAYWGKYKDFLGRNVLVQPSTGNVYSTVVNSNTEVKTYGFGAGINYKMKRNYSVFANGYSDVITDVPSGFMSFFNTPRYRLNAGFGNEGLGKNQKIGFNVVWHWQDAFYSDGDLASGPVSSFNTIDAQVSYNLSKKSLIRVGGTNILNHYYQNSFANPKVGGLYYVSFGFGLHKS